MIMIGVKTIIRMNDKIMSIIRLIFNWDFFFIIPLKTNMSEPAINRQLDFSGSIHPQVTVIP